MNHPDFFDRVETIELQDPLAGFLGTFEQGIIEFSYLDVVKSAGHSCPTVAGAYLCTLEGLKALYPDSIAQRGAIKVEFAQSQTEGVAGVIGAVITNITGATTDYGFQGIGGNFNRRDLMFFNQDIDSSVKLTRVDTGDSVSVNYNPHSIPAKPEMQILMQKIMQGMATPEDKKKFGEVWQERVEAIFDNIDKVITVH
jgi:formylmethanofuran dehydrogenase subunit E